jgi:trehalose 6-phosphate phosphatase
VADPIAVLFERLAGAASAVLALDYDGTLAPFRVERDDAAPLPGVRDTLDGIRRDTVTRLAIVSGRPCADVARLLGLSPPPEIWGSHGWERCFPDGRREIGPLPPGARGPLERIAQVLTDAGFDDLLERKPSGVALHWRGVATARADAARALAGQLWDALPDAHGPLALLAFNHGTELRVTGRDKGHAMRTLIEEAPTGTPIVYIGDDFTDEDAFAAVRPVGLGILVAEEPRVTAAGARVASPRDVLALLQRWRGAAPPRSSGTPRHRSDGGGGDP